VPVASSRSKTISLSSSTDVMVQLSDLQDFDQQVLNSLDGVTGLTQSLKVDVVHGLSSSQVRENRSVFGSNKLPEPEVESFWDFLKEALFEDTTLIILEVSALVQLLFAWFVRFVASGMPTPAVEFILLVQ